MKMNKFFMGLGAVAALSLAACSSDEPVINGPETPDTPSVGQDQAYISVRISEQTQGKSRAEGDEADPNNPTKDFQDGTKYGESTVSSCDFFFYDELGKYVMTSNTLWEQNGNDLTQTIEQKGKSVVVLDQVKQTGYPTYMVTILNKPTDFNAPLTLEGMKEALTNLNNSTSEGPVMNGKNFIMTTTSYSQEGLNPYYFVNKLTANDFYATPQAALDTDHAVKVYVERLAAKATVKLNMGNKVEGEENTYKIELSVAGAGNNQEEADGDYISDYTLHIKFLGWSFNNTLKNSLYSKTINTAWTDEESSLGFFWNSNDFKRSYWAESWKYNNSTTDDFNYFSWNDCENNFWVSDEDKASQNADYVAENTFGAAFANAAGNYSKVTSVILKAKVFDPANPDGEGNFVRYSGLIFTADRFMQYALSRVDANIWVSTGANTFEQVSTGYSMADDKSLNTVWTEFATDAATAYYKKTEDTENPYVLYTDEELAAEVAKVNENLSKILGEGFQGGMMYYNVPIQHLRVIPQTEGEDGQKLPARSFANQKLLEGDYGVVRNHYYNIVINNVYKLGTGVWNPDVDIIDNNPPKDEEYYVGAEVNILAWRIVNNNVDL